MKQNLLRIYKELGFQDRYHYFNVLSKKFNIPIMKIMLKAEELGIEADFDELLDWVKRHQDGTV